jgi:hypothetical protein
VGDEFYERLNSESAGLHASQWLRALAEDTGAELRASVAGGTGDWPPLWALLCGLALTTPPGDLQSSALIAAVCRSRGAVLATRNLPDFDGTGVEIINPWTSASG